MTSNVDWDSTLYDNTISNLPQFYDPEVDEAHHSIFDEQGYYLHQMVATHSMQVESEYFDVHKYADYTDIINDIFDLFDPALVQDIYQVQSVQVNPSTQDYNLLRPFFAWAPATRIQRTLAVTTQYAWGCVSDTIQQHWKSCFPACNVHRHNEAVATDTIFSDTPAVDSGVKAAQPFVARTSLIADVYGVKTDKEFVNILEDNIHKWGAMDKLIRD
jgi:hypothetical protein